MVWAVVTYTENTPLFFIDKEVEINLEIYQKKILKEITFLRARRQFGNEDWTFEQAPSHKARKVQLKENG